MDAGVASFRSILDKPLTQLTEEDISQLTREDCRKYLKEKGMRRPSWNKSQAIQQVISLKALLETPEDSGSGAGALRKILVSKPPATQNSADSAKELTVDEPSSAPDSPKSTPAPPPPPPPEESVAAESKAIAPRSPSATNGSAGQMTIFYCGKVNVYDGVPPDKARAIMHLAASPTIHLPLDDPNAGTTPLSFPCHLQTESDKHGIILPSTTISQTTQTEKMAEYPQLTRDKGNIHHDSDVEGQANRKMSVQRYLEKRKDRGRFKGRKAFGPTSSSLEVYLNHRTRTHTSNGQLTNSSKSSPPQLGQNAMCSSADNQATITSFSVDLNEDVQER